MGNWSTTPGTTVVDAGTQQTLTLDITISPNSGYSVSPSNFVIGGAVETSTNVWEGGNVHNIVTKVIFLQSGNNVIARVFCEEASFVASSDIFVDIDESQVDPVSSAVNFNGACLSLEHPFPVNSSVSIQGLSGTVLTQTQVGTSSTPTKWSAVRHENGMTSTLMFTAVITADQGYHLVGAPSVEITSLGGVEGSFTTQTVFNGAAISYTTATVSVLYTEDSESASLTPCEFGNNVYINYAITPNVVNEINTVHGVAAMANIGKDGGGLDIKVLGVKGSKYALTATDSTNKTYNWTTNMFTASATSYTGTIGARGVKIQTIMVDKVGGPNGRYIDLTVASVDSSVLGPDVPTAAGEKRITQYGDNVMSIGLVSYQPVGAPYYGSIANTIEVIRPVRYTGDKYDNKKELTAIVRGRTAGLSNKIKIQRIDKSLKVGMIATGSNIPHNTTVEGIDGFTVLLSASVNLAATQTIRCYSKDGSLIPFSFVVAPAAGKTLAVNAATVISQQIWGFGNVNTLTGDVGVQMGGSPQNLNLVSTNGILKLMNVTGSGIAAGTYVSSITNSTTIVLSQQFSTTVPANSRMTFIGANNPNTRLVSAQATYTAPNVTIEGYISVPKLDSTSKIHIFLDDIINVS